MAVQYDWNKICKAAKNNVGHIITIFDMIVYNRRPRDTRDSRMLFYGKDYSGQSYMVNPKGLLESKHNFTYKEIAQYIALASYRNYSDYIITGDTTLSLLKSPVSPHKLTGNRLLQIDKNIKFLFEEVPKEN
jgi:hypothetical protein